MATPYLQWWNTDVTVSHGRPAPVEPTPLATPAGSKLPFAEILVIHRFLVNTCGDLTSPLIFKVLMTVTTAELYLLP